MLQRHHLTLYVLKKAHAGSYRLAFGLVLHIFRYGSTSPRAHGWKKMKTKTIIVPRRKWMTSKFIPPCGSAMQYSSTSSNRNNTLLQHRITRKVRYLVLYHCSSLSPCNLALGFNQEFSRSIIRPPSCAELFKLKMTPHIKYWLVFSIDICTCVAYWLQTEREA